MHNGAAYGDWTTERLQIAASCRFQWSRSPPPTSSSVTKDPSCRSLRSVREHSVRECPCCVFVCEVRVLAFHKLSARVRDASKIETAWISNFGSRMGVGGSADSICCREHLARQPTKVPLASAAVPSAGRGKHGLACGLWIHGAFLCAPAGMPDISDHGSECLAVLHAGKLQFAKICRAL